MGWLKKNTLKSMRDLILFNSKIPEDRRAEIFSTETLKGFLESIVGITNWYSYSPRQTKLAALLVEIGITICKLQNSKLNKNSPSLAEVTNDYLEKATLICRDIAYRIELENFQKETEEGIVYLFRWNHIFDEDRDLSVEYLSKLGPSEIREFKVDRIRNTKTCILDNPNESFFATVEMHIDSKKCKITVMDKEIKLLLYEELLVKQYNDDFAIYEKKRKKQRK